MCGIAGWFAARGAAPNGDPRAVLARAIESIGHRGPDGRAGVLADDAALGHARLAIIDLSGGNQPMWSSDRRAVIVMNGEIFNHVELRNDLARRGHAFRTRSDTEVALALWREGGAAALARLRGMYAFAIWDRDARRGVLARDPLGIKPLFVGERGGCLAFGSEAKAILAIEGADGRLDEAALHLLLNFRYVPGNGSLFRGIRQLDPGEVLVWEASGVRSERVPPPVPADHPDLEAALEDSVRAHLVSDVEVGAYLSGGIDSAVVASLAARSRPDRLRVFTLPVGDDPDEARNAAATAEILGLDHRIGGVDADVDYGDVLLALEAPKVNAWQSYALARFARRDVKVVLSGLGGDELFLGYNAHRILDVAARASRALPRSWSRVLGRSGAALLSSLSRTPNHEPLRAMRMLEALGDWPVVYGLVRNVWDSAPLRRTFYGERMLASPLPDAFDWLRAAWPVAAHPVDATADFEWTHKMVNDLLWHEDRTSMASGLEVRVPFVDASLRQWLDRGRRAVPVADRLGKRQLRRAAARWLPGSILGRRKSGFQLAPTAFARGPLRDYIEEWLSESRVRAEGLFRPDAIRALRALPARRAHRWHWFMLFLMAQSHHWVHGFERGGFRRGTVRAGAAEVRIEIPST